jgi:NitT/TauT family transport system ATP-binding protein
MNSTIRVSQVSKSFVRGQQEVAVLSKMSLEITQESFVAIVGPSGCGKSTLLNIMAGLLPATAGNIFYKGSPMKSPRPEIGYLTQNDTLMPWRSVARNIEMPLEIRKINKKERQHKANDLIEKVGLKGFEKHYPRELSGGMLRRSSLARLLIADPETLLMDEPFAALDAQLRLELQDELLKLWEANQKTVVFVTHDLEEALALGDRVVVLGSRERIVLDESISLPRPREASTIRFQPAFATLHQRLWQALMQARSQKEASA